MSKLQRVYYQRNILLMYPALYDIKLNITYIMRRYNIPYFSAKISGAEKSRQKFKCVQMNFLMLEICIEDECGEKRSLHTRCNDQTLIADSLLASNPTEAAKQDIASKGLHKIYHRKTENTNSDDGNDVLESDSTGCAPPLLSLDAVKIKLKVNKYDPGWTANSHHYPKGGSRQIFCSSGSITAE